ncbi:hypothetical protein HOLleu_31794 [Holothuria leucospilota]|uniref:Uncharacterized protein n=1 Tax=Holothuria leucospilota TaxID=206669 RepID=A0A9Q0YQY2_HOLLE|nr:hypothetical protein HOLleu_31794 [Holothuria leucospilota]
MNGTCNETSLKKESLGGKQPNTRERVARIFHEPVNLGKEGVNNIKKMPRQNRRQRGRGGRNFHRGRRNPHRAHSQANNEPYESEELMREMKGQSGEVERSKLIKKVTDKPHLVFINNAGFDLHYDLQDSIHDNYWATLLALVKSGYEISVGNKALILAAAWAHKDHVMADRLLALKDHFGLVEVIKALSLLDSGRKIREWEKKLRRMELQKDKPKKGKLSKCKQNIENLKSVQPKVGSVSGALIRHIKKWVHLHTKEELEYFALFYPKENWKKLADICHLNPKKDFQVIPWFLPHCFGEAAPDGSLVQRCSLITAENVNELVSGNEVPFSHIKSLSNVLNDASKVRIATYSKNLSTVLW